MSIPEYRIKEQWLGTGALKDYTFDFTIQDPTHLLLILQDQFGNEIARFRGDDNTYLSGIIFDAKNGGGTISLLDFLGDSWVINAFLAPDAPIQPSEFRGKFNFTLELFEFALDRLVCQIQRLAYFAARSVKLHDLDDVTKFDPTLPRAMASNPGASIVIDSTGTKLAYGATMSDIANAAGYAAQALSSKNDAVAAEVAAAASAAAAAASAAAATCNVAVYGTQAVPLVITAAGGITPHAPQEEMQIINAAGAIVLTANPQIVLGTVRGQKISLLGMSDATTITLTNGNGLSMNGDIVLGLGDFIQFMWDGVIWQEMFRRR